MTTSPETLAAGDPDPALRVAALFEEHGRTVLGLCRFLLRDAAEAEDAAQQSFLSAYRSLLGGAVPREPGPWLAAIARNECWLRIKRRMREPLALPEVPSEQADPIEVVARNADFAALRAGLEQLPRPQREAFLLREFAGLSYSEVSLALGVTEPAVDSLLFRARTRLRRALRSVNALLVPVALRDQLARLIPGFDQPAAGTLAKLASLPIAAKLAAAGAGAVLVVAGSAGLERPGATDRVRQSVAAPRQPVTPRARARLSASPLERAIPTRTSAPGASGIRLVLATRTGPPPTVPQRQGDEAANDSDHRDAAAGRETSERAEEPPAEGMVVAPTSADPGVAPATGPGPTPPADAAGDSPVFASGGAKGPGAESGSDGSGSGDGRSVSARRGSDDAPEPPDVPDSPAASG